MWPSLAHQAGLLLLPTHCTPRASAPGPSRQSWAGWWGHGGLSPRQCPLHRTVITESQPLLHGHCGLCLLNASVHLELDDDIAGVVGYFKPDHFLESHISAPAAVAVRQAPAISSHSAIGWCHRRRDDYFCLVRFKTSHGSWSKGLLFILESVVCCPSYTPIRTCIGTDTMTRLRRFLMCVDIDDSNSLETKPTLTNPVELWLGRNYSAAQCLVLASVVKSNLLNKVIDNLKY